MTSGKTRRIDLFKIGVFIGGISFLIIAFVVLQFYLQVQSYRPSYIPEPFYASCPEKIVIISANEEIKSAEVQDVKGSRLCSFDRIPAKSEEYCVVEAEGHYVVKVGERKKVVGCREYKEIVPIPID